MEKGHAVSTHGFEDWDTHTQRVHLHQEHGVGYQFSGDWGDYSRVDHHASIHAGNPAFVSVDPAVFNGAGQ